MSSSEGRRYTPSFIHLQHVGSSGIAKSQYVLTLLFVCLFLFIFLLIQTLEFGQSDGDKMLKCAEGSVSHNTLEGLAMMSYS